MFNQGMDYIWSILRHTDNSKYLNQYVQSLVAEYYNTVGWVEFQNNLPYAAEVGVKWDFQHVWSKI